MKSSSAITSDLPVRDRAQLWALFVLIVYAPLPMGSNRPWSLAVLGILSGILLLWSLWKPAGRSAASVWRSARMPWVLFGLWMLLLAMQFVVLPSTWMGELSAGDVNAFDAQGGGILPVSIDLYSTQLYWANACILTIIFWLVVTLVNSRRRIEMLAKVIVFSGLCQALIGVVLMASGTTFQLFFVEVAQPRGHGTFVSPNNFAGYLELTLAVGIGLMIGKLDGSTSVSWRQRVHGWLLLLISEKAMLRLSLIVMVVGLVASRSRMGNAAFFTSLLVVGVFTIIFAKHETKHANDKGDRNTLRATIVFIMSLIVLDVVIIGGVVGVEKVVQRLEKTNLQAQSALVELQTTPKNKELEKGGAVGVGAKPIDMNRYEQSVEERGEAVMPSIQIIRDFPLLGTGGGTFYLAFPHYRPPEIRWFYDHPHNDYVEFASEVGLLGVLLLVILVAHSVWSSVLMLVRSHDQLARGMAFASLMGVTSLLIHGAVDFNFQNTANAMLFLILLGFPYLFFKLKH